MDINERLKMLHMRIAALEANAPSAESHFFDSPQYKSVREFGESEAISNSPETATKAVKNSDAPDRGVAEAKKESLLAPPPPEEVLETQPGAAQFSTLSQFLVETKESIKGVPQGYEDTPKAKPIKPTSEKTHKEEKQEAVQKMMRRLGYGIR